mgnify:CR=1 FL=1
MFKELNPLIHSQLRLAIMTLLLSVEEADFTYLTSFPQLFYPLMTRQFFCDFHEKSEDFCVS